jgi:uncharacterized protein
LEKVHVTVLGLSTSPSALGTFALILTETGGKRRLPIIIGSSEAQSIALEIESIKPPRPLTHDLIKNMFEVFGASVTEVVVDDLKDGVFFAKIYVELNGIKTAIDSRPSDAIALAVRTHSEIYVSDQIMQEAAIEPGEDELQDSKSETEDTNIPTSKPLSSKPLDKINLLENDLNQAILKEDYEKAARLRDEINKLKS